MDQSKVPFKMPSFDVTGKVAIVTGGTKGLGYGCAVTLAYFGAKVVITSRHQDECDKIAQEIKDMGGEAYGCKCDVTNLDEIDALMAKTLEVYGRLDIMVSNAGVSVTKFAVQNTEADYDKVLNTNLKSVYFCETKAAKIMIDQGEGGTIINMASIGALKGSNALATYGASKAGVVNMTKSLAVEWGRYGIRVNAVCPGYVKTALNAEYLDDPEYAKKQLKGIPLKRFGEIREVGAVVAFLACDASSMITGEKIVCDMGATING